MTRTYSTGLAVAGLLAASCAVAGAGPAGAVSSSDGKAITATVRLIEQPEDPATSCAKGFTSAFRKKLFGTAAQCEVVLTQTLVAGGPENVKVTGISVSGSSATAKVKEIGGQSSGATGTWKLAKSGKTWKVSDIDVVFFRSSYSAALGPTYTSDGPASDPLDAKAYRACGLKKILDRTDKQFLVLVYQQNSSRNVEFGKAFAACTAKAPGGKSPFFKVLEASIRKLAKNSNFSAAEASCVVKKIRAAYTEPALINMMSDGGGTPSGDMYGERLQNAANSCSKGGKAGLRAPKEGAPPVR